MRVVDCNKCQYKQLCEDIEIDDLSCEDIKRIAEVGKKGESHEID